MFLKIIYSVFNIVSIFLSRTCLINRYLNNPFELLNNVHKWFNSQVEMNEANSEAIIRNSLNTASTTFSKYFALWLPLVIIFCADERGDCRFFSNFQPRSLGRSQESSSPSF